MAKTKEILVHGQLTTVTEFDSTAQEIDDAVGKVKKGYTFADVGAAPAGYGLGEKSAIAVNSIDEITANGWYAFWSESDVPGRGVIVCHATCDDRYGYVLLETSTPNGVMYRRKTDGVWGKWFFGSSPITCIWENAATMSDFAEQEIELDLSGYDFIQVFGKYESTSVQYLVSSPYVPTNVGSIGCLRGFGSGFWGGARDFTITENGVSFGSGNQVNIPTDAVYNNWNNRVIPSWIIGIKGVLQ